MFESVMESLNEIATVSANSASSSATRRTSSYAASVQKEREWWRSPARRSCACWEESLQGFGLSGLRHLAVWRRGFSSARAATPSRRPLSESAAKESPGRQADTSGHGNGPHPRADAARRIPRQRLSPHGLPGHRGLRLDAHRLRGRHSATGHERTCAGGIYDYVEVFANNQPRALPAEPDQYHGNL